MNLPLLEVQNVSKNFGGLKALNEINFQVMPGELLGIAGPNGSGKSTLFNVLTKIPFGPSSGKIHFNGQRIDNLPAYKIAQLGLTRTFQKDAEFPDLSARETVALASVYGQKQPSRAALACADEKLADINFDIQRMSLPTTELSVYERKQIMIASALVMNPRILLLDEPASGLTKPEIQALENLLVEVNSSGISIILIEHVLSLLLSVSERLIVLNQGELIANNLPDEVIQNPLVVEAYLGKRTA